MPDIDYNMIFHLSPLPIYVIQDGRFRLVNPKMCEISGYTEEELLKIPYTDLIHPADRARMEEIALRELAGNPPGGNEFMALNRAGETLFIRGVFTRIELNGAPAILGQVMDITEQKRAWEELEKSEEKYRLLLDSIEDGYYEVDLAGNLLQCNEATARISGVTDRRPLIGMNFREYIDDKSVEKVFQAYNKVFKTGRPEKGLILEMNTQDHQKKILEVSVSLYTDSMGRPAGFRGILRDITDRKKAEEKLKLNEARLEALIKLDQMTTSSLRDLTDFALEEGVRLTDSLLGFLAFPSEDEKVLTMHSWSSMAMRECAIKDKTFVYPLETTGLWGEVLRHRKPVIVNDCSLASPLKKGFPGGHVALERFMSVPVFDGDRIVVVAGVANKKEDYDNSDADQLTLLMSGMWRIIQRRKADEAVRVSEERFSKAFNASPVSMAVLVFPEWRFIDVNTSFLKNTGYGREEVIGRTPVELDLFYGRGGEFAERALKNEGGVRELETTIRIKSGHMRTGLLALEKIEISGRQCILASFYDITERKQMEEQLKYLSLHDPLTGLYNRAYFEEEMNRLGKRRQGQLGIIMCDLDGLKQVNDTLGHSAGDGLLAAAARVIRESFRENDLVSRIGGDEFAVLLPDCDRAAVENACRRIRQAIERHNEAGRGPALSISVGYSIAEAPVDLGQVFKEADNNMYREKLHRSQSNRSAVVQTLIKTLEARDFMTEGHADRLQELVAGLAGGMGLPDHSIADLCIFAQFHDIGKVGIPDSILFKPGPLTAGEVAEMQRHSEIGHLIASLPHDLAPVADWILKHHEWWNGEGYPLKLKGEEIPLECRILAIADAYDAMTNDRPYRKAMTHEEAVAELKRCSGSQFDPNLVPLFIDMLEKRRTVQPA